jgi:hypothetical protein
VLDGQDYTGLLYHVICLGRFRGITPKLGFIARWKNPPPERHPHFGHPAWIGNTSEDDIAGSSTAWSLQQHLQC